MEFPFKCMTCGMTGRYISILSPMVTVLCPHDGTKVVWTNHKLIEEAPKIPEAVNWKKELYEVIELIFND